MCARERESPNSPPPPVRHRWRVVVARRPPLLVLGPGGWAEMHEYRDTFMRANYQKNISVWNMSHASSCDPTSASNDRLVFTRGTGGLPGLPARAGHLAEARERLAQRSGVEGARETTSAVSGLRSHGALLARSLLPECLTTQSQRHRPGLAAASHWALSDSPARLECVAQPEAWRARGERPS